MARSYQFYTPVVRHCQHQCTQHPGPTDRRRHWPPDHGLQQRSDCKLPTLESHQLAPTKLVSHTRKHIDEFVNTTVSEFTPLDEAKDSEVWSSDNPIGAVIKIDVFWPDNAAIVCAEPATDHWRFITIHTDETGDHPVSGTREFGIFKSGRYWIWYTRGVARPTGFLDVDWPVVLGEDELWQSMQRKTKEWIDNHGGEAENVPPAPIHVDWDPNLKRMGKRAAPAGT